MNQSESLTIKYFLLGSLFTLVLTLYYTFLTPKSYAQQPCTTSNLNQGLISALSVTGGTIGNTDQTCVVDPQATYRDFKVPSYEDLENQFYNTSKSTAKRTEQLQGSSLDFGDAADNNGIYLQTTSMTVSSVTGRGVQIIFVRGNLTINGNINYADTDSYSGLVFIVSGNINIDSNVTKVNAVLISSGEICTAYISASSSCSSGTAYTPQLVVNGSLISINKIDLPNPLPAIKLTRNLTVNTQPAEVINKQAKYLYILKGGLFTKDLVLTQEDSGYLIPSPIPSASAVATPTPTPGPSSCPGANPLVVQSTIPFVQTCVIGI